jgi:hypothetical protein
VLAFPLYYQETVRIMNSSGSRNVVVGAIVGIGTLMVAVAFAAIFGGDLSERAGGILTTVLGYLGGAIAGLFLLMKVDVAAGKADDARTEAQQAARAAARAVKKTEEVHHDLLNGGLRENVKKAISEDRHALRSRKAAERMRPQAEARGMPKRDKHE